jgi:hypothetical protein
VPVVFERTIILHCNTLWACVLLGVCRNVVSDQSECVLCLPLWMEHAITTCHHAMTGLQAECPLCRQPSPPNQLLRIYGY